VSTCELDAGAAALVRSLIAAFRPELDRGQFHSGTEHRESRLPLIVKADAEFATTRALLAECTGRRARAPEHMPYSTC
jgi:hypothetical protein